MKKRKTLSPLKQWENLTLADNFIFCKVMETNPDICKELLELLLNIKIDRIEKPKSEYTLKVDSQSKGVRFDVYVKDGSGRCFDIEIQTSTDENLALAKRARYYQGLMDVDNVFRGNSYTTLKETFVIFLCLGDAFGYGLPVYTFQNICEEDNSIKMNDGTKKVFFNARLYDKMQSEELKSFFKYLCGKSSASSFTDKISETVNRVKKNAEWRKDYMFFEEIIKQNRDEAYEESCIQTAQRMLEDLMPAETVARYSGLSLEKVEELQKEMEPVKA